MDQLPKYIVIVAALTLSSFVLISIGTVAPLGAYLFIIVGGITFLLSIKYAYTHITTEGFKNYYVLICFVFFSVVGLYLLSKLTLALSGMGGLAVISHFFIYPMALLNTGGIINAILYIIEKRNK
jgi:hypothetical protein